MCHLSPGCDCRSFHMQRARRFTPPATKSAWLHKRRIRICYSFPYAFLKAWISVRASVNIHFLKCFFFLHNFGPVPWLRTTAPSLCFLRLSLRLLLFSGPDSTWLWRGQHLCPWPQAGRSRVRGSHLSMILPDEFAGRRKPHSRIWLCLGLFSRLVISCCQTDRHIPNSWVWAFFKPDACEVSGI